MQSRLRLVKPVQIPDQPLHPFVRRIFEKIEIEPAILVPFAPLREFLAHEQELLAGMRPHEAVIGAKIGELLPVIARHFVEQRGLAMHHFIMAERQHEILGKGIKQAERQLVMVPFPVHGIVRHIGKRIVHETKVPFEPEAKAARIGRRRHSRPSRRLLRDGHGARMARHKRVH